MMREKRFMPRRALDDRAKSLIIQKLKEILLSQESILFSYIYGSFIREGSFRDIDVAIYSAQEKGFDPESAISRVLSDAVGLEVEARIINNAPVSFQMAVLKEGQLLFSRDEAVRTDFIARVGSRYREYTHFRNLFLGIEGRRHEGIPES